LEVLVNKDDVLGAIIMRDEKRGEARRSHPTKQTPTYAACSVKRLGASHSKNTYLSALYRRQRGKLRHNQAIFALAHQLLLIAYTMLSRSEDYREFGSDYFDRKNKPKVVNRLVERLTKLGFYVTLQPAVTPAQDPPPLSPDGSSSTGANPSIPSSHALLSASSIRKRGRPCKCTERKIPCKHAAPDNLTS
jgi:hypothetical protein